MPSHSKTVSPSDTTEYLVEVLHPATQSRIVAVVTDPKRYFRSVRSLLSRGRHHNQTLQMAYNASKVVECSVLQVGGPESNLSHLARSLTHPSILNLNAVKPAKRSPGKHSRPVKPWTFAGDLEFAAQFDFRYAVRHTFNVEPTNVEDVTASLRNPPRTRPTDNGPFLLHHFRRMWDALPYEQIREALALTADALEGGPRPKALWLVMGLHVYGLENLPDIISPTNLIEAVKGLVAGSTEFEAEFDIWAGRNQKQIWSALCWT